MRRRLPLRLMLPLILRLLVGKAQLRLQLRPPLTLLDDLRLGSKPRPRADHRRSLLRRLRRRHWPNPLLCLPHRR